MEPAYRILTPRLQLRCWSPADAPALQRTVRKSLAHLRPWMDFVQNEPEPLAATVARLRRWRADFDSDRDFSYAVLGRPGFGIWGGCALHPRGGPGSFEVGYWLHAARTRKGYAREMAAALVRVAFDLLDARRVEIHCDARNLPSARVPEVLGFTHEPSLGYQRQDVDHVQQVMVWELPRAAYAQSAAAQARLRAFGAAGERRNMSSPGRQGP